MIVHVNPREFNLYHKHSVQRTVYHELYVHGNRQRCFTPISLQYPEAAYVAVCKQSLGEGCERFAFQCYEVASEKAKYAGGRASG
jgi:hypothetical protein